VCSNTILWVCPYDRVMSVWCNHTTCKWVKSRVIDLCPKWMNHVTRQWVMWHVNESWHDLCIHVNHFHMRMIHVTCKWKIWRANESCDMTHSEIVNELLSHANESSHMRMKYVRQKWNMWHVKESWFMWQSHIACELVISHANESLLRAKESCHIWISYVVPLRRSLDSFKGLFLGKDPEFFFAKEIWQVFREKRCPIRLILASIMTNMLHFREWRLHLISWCVLQDSTHPTMHNTQD